MAYEKLSKKLMPGEKASKNIKSTVLEGIIMVENGCKWRALPKKFGNWHTIYMRFSRWTKNETIQRIFEELQKQNVIETQSEFLSLDSTSIKVHPNASGAKKSVESKVLVAQKGAND